MAGVRGIDDHSLSQQRTFRVPTMKLSELHAVTVCLDVLRDIMVELVAALPPERAAGFVAALGDRLACRLGAMKINKRAEDAMLSDLAPVFAALSQRTIKTQEAWRGLHQAGR